MLGLYYYYKGILFAQSFRTGDGVEELLVHTTRSVCVLRHDLARLHSLRTRRLAKFLGWAGENGEGLAPAEEEEFARAAENAAKPR